MAHEISVLMVCLGNICRSPMAEGVFRHILAAEGLQERIRVDSAGTGSWHVGESPDVRSVRTAAVHGVKLAGNARQVRPEDFRTFDFIVAADVLEHLRDLEPVVEELNRLLVPGGRLVISAPSENVLYAVGRKLFGFTKPEDHYHEPRDIEESLARHLKLQQKRYLPLDLYEGLSAFVLFSFGKPNTG